MTNRGFLDVLVVDDEAPFADAVSSVLARRGHRVTTAHAAHEALRRDRLDVLVADLNLPDATGLDLLSALHDRGERPFTVFVSGSPTFEDCRRALRLGAAEFLPKPLRLDDLVRVVERAPRRARHDPESHAGEYGSSPAEVARAVRELLAFALRCEFGPAARARIGSAACEIFDNARRHAYPGRDGPIRVRAHREARELVVTIRDEGIGFDSDAARADLDTARYGLARASAVAERFHVDSAPHVGTRVTFAFAAWRSDFDADVGLDLSELDYFDPSAARRVLHAVKHPDVVDLAGVSPALAVVVGRWLARVPAPWSETS